jgi:hypothetical protein
MMLRKATRVPEFSSPSLALRLRRSPGMDDDSIVRKEFPTAHEGCVIHVTTERLAEGEWAVVSAVKHRSDFGEKTVDLPVPDRTFATQADAEDFGARIAVEYLDRNAPRGDAAAA